MAVVAATDTCERCGLRRLTRALEERGIQIRLCDDCYWGKEPPAPAEEQAENAA